MARILSSRPCASSVIVVGATSMTLMRKMSDSVRSSPRWLGVQRTNDLPGSEAPRAWRDWLARGATALLPGVLLHNRIDLLSLLAVGIYAGGYLADLLAEQAYSPAPEVHGVYGVHGAPGASAQSLAAATRHDKGVQSRSGASIAWHRLFASSAKRARDAAPALAL